MTTRVTVFMPVFNAERYVGQAVESVLAQTWADFELLVIDDASTDASVSVISNYLSDVRVRLLRHSKNRGQAVTRNEGIAYAGGEYIAFLDADDYCAPTRLTQQASYLDRHPEVAAVGTQINRVDENGYILPQQKSDKVPLNSVDVAIEFLFGCPFHHPTMMARIAILASYKYCETFKAAEDYDLFARLSNQWPIRNLPDRLLFYREHALQATSVKQNEMKRESRIIVARQLNSLGVEFDSQDIVNQELMRCGNRVFRSRTGRKIDSAYIRWARSWLQKLLDANARVGSYREPDFSHTVGRIWLHLCRKAARDAGASVWFEFLQANLTRAGISAYLWDMSNLIKK